MAKFSKMSGVMGTWINKKELHTGDVIKLVSEAKEEDSNLGGKQIVAKCRVRGYGDTVLNIAINKPSLSALIDAYGEESLQWIGHHLTAHVEKTVVGGKRGIALYLLPEGFDVIEDNNGYVVISRRTGATPTIPTPYRDEPAIEYPPSHEGDVPFENI